ncbi:MAG TPA: ester cyclase [Streptosporangiaceae bacterium]|nr:ester cyclase [Streptosporangiaceae bacterium]
MTSELGGDAVEDNARIEQVVRGLYDEVWTGRRYEFAEDLFHPDFSYAGAPGLHGAEAKLKAIRSYHEGFPDLRVTIDDLVMSADRAVARYTFSGTDLGGVRGRQPT